MHWTVVHNIQTFCTGEATVDEAFLAEAGAEEAGLTEDLALKTHQASFRKASSSKTSQTQKRMK